MIKRKKKNKDTVEQIDKYLEQIENVKYAVDQMIMFSWYGDDSTAEYIYNEMDDWSRKEALFQLIAMIPVEPLEPPDPVEAVKL